MTEYRAGQRVRIEVEGVVLEAMESGALRVTVDVDGESWYLRAPAHGVTVTVLSEPRPEEPTGLGAVVEARVGVWGLRRWLRNFSGLWVTDHPIMPVPWSDLIDPVVLSEGWKP